MLRQLWDIALDYQYGSLNKVGAWVEVRIWLDQHCLDADDFTFSLALALRDYVTPNASVRVYGVWV